MTESDSAASNCKALRMEGFFVVRSLSSAMPTSAPRPCTMIGCNALVRDGSGRCAQHPKPQWVRKPTASKRVTGRRLQAMRAALFARNPLCVACEAQGFVTLATQRDHKVPLAEGGADDDDNTQGLCDPCHEAKSLQEALRGRRRAGEGAPIFGAPNRKPTPKPNFDGE